MYNPITIRCTSCGDLYPCDDCAEFVEEEGFLCPTCEEAIALFEALRSLDEETCCE